MCGLIAIMVSVHASFLSCHTRKTPILTSPLTEFLTEFIQQLDDGRPLNPSIFTTVIPLTYQPLLVDATS